MKAAALLLASALLLALAGPAPAASNLTVAVAVKPGMGQGLLAEKFQLLLAAEGKGRYKVDVSYQDSGGDETQILNRLKSGQVQLAVVSPGPLDRMAPLVRLIEYPFMFRDYLQAEKVLDGRAGQEVLKSLEKSGFKGLAFGENGFRHLTNSQRPVRQAQDIKGLRVRVMESSLHQRIWEMLGASPLPHPWPVDDLLARGVIDGQENPLQLIWGYRLDRQQPHLSLTAHSYAAVVCLANLDWFNSLPARERKLVQEAMLKAARHQRTKSRDLEAQSLAQLKKAGVKVEEKPDRDSLRKRTADLGRDPLFAGSEMQSALKLFQRLTR